MLSLQPDINTHRNNNIYTIAYKLTNYKNVIRKFIINYNTLPMQIIAI